METTLDPAGEQPTGKTRTPLRSQPLGGYWRVPVFALVGAVLAFGLSFAFPSQYPSVSRLLIRPGETSYSSTDSAASLGSNINIGGIDITKQQTLGNTLVNLALSRQAAAEIVKRIGADKILDGQQPELGMTKKLINFLKFGRTGRAPTAREAAIDKVQGSLEAVVLDESWIMEVTAWDTDPEMARELADTAAQVSVDQSEERFRENSTRELEYLNGQIEQARADVAQKAQAVADFKSQNNIIVDTESLAGALSGSSAASLDQLNSQLVGLRAREQVLRSQLASTPRTNTVTVNGPDGQPTRQQQANPEYDAKAQQLESLQGDIAVAEAQFNALAGRLGGGSAPTINEIQAQLTQLQNELDLSKESYKTLNDRYKIVAATVDKPRFDASRVGAASEPTTPGRPLRYLFLVIGALIGALTGLLLTWFRSIREEEEGTDDRSGSRGEPAQQRTRAEDDFVVDVREPVIATNGGHRDPAETGTIQPQLNRTGVAPPVNGALTQHEAQGLADHLRGGPPTPGLA